MPPPKAPVKVANGPPSDLPDRASHVFFLRRFASEKVPGGTGTVGDLTTAQVVKEYVRPATAKFKTNYADCLVRGLLDAKISPKACAGGVMQGVEGTPPAFGRTCYFSSHSWTYKFGELVGLLEGHYAAQPGTQGGTAFVPIYYWVDIIAVTQHFTGDFKDHPDSNFPGVIRASKSVLFTMHPWRSPVAPTRVWCLFEALTALQSAGVGLDVLLDMGNSRDTSPVTLARVVRSIDVRASKAFVPADRYYLLGCIESGIGATAFNSMMRKSLMASLLKAMAAKCVHFGDEKGLTELMKLGACQRPDGVLDVPANLPYCNSSDLVSMLDGVSTNPRGLVLAGCVHCAQVWPEEDPKVKGGWVVNEERYGSRAAWAYLPLNDAAVGAVGRLLQRQPRASAHLLTHGATAGAGDDAGAAAAAAAAAAAGDADADGAGGGGGGGGPVVGLQELWLSLREAKSTGKMISGSGGGGGGASGGDPASPSTSRVRAGSSGHNSPSGAGAAAAATGRVGGSMAAAGIAMAAVGSMRASGPIAGRRAAPAAAMRFAAGAAAAGGGGSGSGSGSPQPASAASRGLAPAALAAEALGLSRGATASSGEGLGGGGGGGIRRQAEVDSGVAGREELWYGLSLNHSSLQLLCLHRSSLSLHDAGRLGEALAQNTVLRVLQVIEPELDASGSGSGSGSGGGGLHAAALAAPPRAWRTRTVSEAYLRESGLGEAPSCGPLTAALLEAALGSSSLQKVHIVPPRAAMVEELRSEAVAAVTDACGGSSSWGASGGAGSSLQELVLAPVVLAPKAAAQLAAVLAALPALSCGLVDGRKVAPRPGWMAATAPADEDWWYDEDGKLTYRYPDGWERRTTAAGGGQWALSPAEVARQTEGRKGVIRSDVVVVQRHMDKERAGRVQYGRPAPAEELMYDLRGPLQALGKEQDAGTAPRTAALLHWLLAAAGPTSVPVPPRGVEFPAGGVDHLELGLLEALEERLGEYRAAMAGALQDAPRSYRDRAASGRVPPARLAGMVLKPVLPAL